MSEFEILGTTDEEKIKQKIDFLKNALNNAEAKVNHIDKMRQTNLNFALVSFAALFGVGLKFSEQLSSTFFLSSVIVLLMVVFTLIDRRLHKINHGWRSTCRLRVATIIKAINDPESEVAYPSYDQSKEEKAELKSLQPVVFYTLIVFGILSYVLF